MLDLTSCDRSAFSFSSSICRRVEFGPPMRSTRRAAIAFDADLLVSTDDALLQSGRGPRQCPRTQRLLCRADGFGPATLVAQPAPLNASSDIVTPGCLPGVQHPADPPEMTFKAVGLGLFPVTAASVGEALVAG